MKPRKHPFEFHLERMEGIYEKAKGRNDAPHRHDYYTVLFVQEASGFHLIDEQKYDFEPNQVHFVAPGQVHQVVVNSVPKGRVVTFSRAFLVENNIPESFISNINLFKQFSETPPLSIDAQTVERISWVINEMDGCFVSELNYQSRALGALLQLFLIYCSNSQKLNITQLDEESSGVKLLREFKTLIEQNFREWHKMAGYASSLNVSAKHLSFTTKNLTGKTAKEMIQDRIILEAKRLLLHTNLSIKEVAYDLGFEEPLHFSSFFKKCTKQSPSDFKSAKH